MQDHILKPLPVPSTVQLIIRSNNQIIPLLILPHLLLLEILLHKRMQLGLQIVPPSYLDRRMLRRRWNNANVYQDFMLADIQLTLVFAVEEVYLACLVRGYVHRYF